MKETAEILQEISDYCLEKARLYKELGPEPYYKGNTNAYSDIIEKIDELANKLDK